MCESSSRVPVPRRRGHKSLLLTHMHREKAMPELSRKAAIRRPEKASVEIKPTNVGFSTSSLQNCCSQYSVSTICDNSPGYAYMWGLQMLWALQMQNTGFLPSLKSLTRYLISVDIFYCSAHIKGLKANIQVQCLSFGVWVITSL